MNTTASGVRRSISLRPATPEDAELLVAIYASTRADELALVTWWSDEQKSGFVQMQSEAQHDHYLKTYPQAQYSIVTIDDRPAGRLYLADLEMELRILDLTLLPEYRNSGVGTDLLVQLLAESTKKNKALGVYVEGFNPALRLLERLGFAKVNENGIYFLMQRPPSGGATTETTD